MGKGSKDQLVSEYLENVGGEVLKEYPELVREFIRKRHGIYALYQQSRLYYVGLAKNLGWRLKQHLRDRHAGLWDRFSIYITNSQDHMKDLESLFLRIAKPTGNKVKGKFVRATLLNRPFKSKLLRLKKGEAYKIIGDGWGKPRTPKKAAKRSTKDGRQPVLAPYAGNGFAIRMVYRGRTIKARVKSDGTVEYNGKLYTSPSIAGARARGRKTLNGWKVWKYKNEQGEWVYLDELRKKRGKKTAAAGRGKDFDTIICPAREDGFNETFLGENCWYAIRINLKKIQDIKYIAVYRMRPVSAVTHYARVARIVPYKKTGKYLVKFAGKPKRLLKPVQRKRGDWAPGAPFFNNLRTIRSTTSFEDLRPK